METPQSNRGRPFRSRLEPHVEFIHAQRALRRTWAQIACDLTNQECTITTQGLHQFYRRYLRRKPSWERTSVNTPGLPPAPLAGDPAPTLPERRPYLPTTTYRRPDPKQLKREDYT